ncbi:hypothetical protein P7C70_g3680, partial [Phenoliferia sp. Uapishka_3]
MSVQRLARPQSCLANVVPPEILAQIFDYYPTDILGNMQELTRFALVCKQWRGSAQRALMLSVHLWTEREAALWFASKAREDNETEHLALDEAVLFMTTVIVEIVGEAVGTLTVESYQGYKAVRKHVGPYAKIRELRLTVTKDFQLPIKPLECRLKGLSVSIDDEVTLNSETCHAIFHSSRNTLTELHIPFDLSYALWTLSESLDTILSSEPFPNVQRLTLSRIPDDYKFPTSFALIFPFLVDLYVTTQSGGDDTDELYKSLGIGIPPSVKTLTIGPGTSLDDWYVELLKMLRQPSFASLGRLNLPGRRKSDFKLADGQMEVEEGEEEVGEPNMSGLELLKECQDRNIVVECRFGIVTWDELTVKPKRGAKKRSR